MNRGVETDATPPRAIVRRAREEDLEEISQVIRSAYAEYLPRIPGEHRSRYIDRTADARSRFTQAEILVAELDGRIVGTVTVYPHRAGESVQGWPEGWAGLRVLAVAPEARGLGIGRHLVEEGIALARTLGARALGLHTTDMMAIARAMYERMGFARVPEHDFHPSSGGTIYAYRYDLDE